MASFIETLFFCSLVLTFVTLAFGLAVYFKGGSLNARYGNAAMRWRITFQAITLGLFLMLLWIKH